MHPSVMSGAVANPNSSAPSRHAMATSRPVLSCPSVCSTVRARRLFAISVWCVSDRPSSHGRPQPFTPVHFAAPVPPSWPAMSTCEAGKRGGASKVSERATVSKRADKLASGARRNIYGSGGRDESDSKDRPS
eukprot:1888413-Pyramimonas_sp.AAC.1